MKRAGCFIKQTLSLTVLRSFRHSCEHWRIAIRKSPTALLDDESQALSSFRWIHSPRGHFYADPMLFQHEKRIWLFVEDYLYADNAAHQNLVAEVTVQGTIGPFQPAMTRPYHLSYPLVFSHAGEVFMVPETAANRTVELYRAVHSR